MSQDKIGDENMDENTYQKQEEIDDLDEYLDNEVAEIINRK